jgi:hypothetical protein
LAFNQLVVAVFPAQAGIHLVSLSFLLMGMTKSNKKTLISQGFLYPEQINLKKFDSLLKEKRLISQSFSVPFTIKLSNHFIVDLKRLHYAYMLLTKKPQFPVAQF